MVSGVIQRLICKPINTENTNRNNSGGSVGKSYSHVLCWLRPRDPWAMQLKLQQTREGAGESPVPQNWAHSAKGAHPYRRACRSRGIKVAAPPLDLPCDRPVTCPGDSKILVKSSTRRNGQTL